MRVGKQDLLALFSGSNVEFEIIEHAAAMTADAQTAAMTGISGSVIKNLFLKDKKGRHFIISTLCSTKVDLKVLSARLGLGKGGISMAAAESVEEVLKVPLGSVTPLAIANAAGVTLLLDVKILSEQRVLVHPMINTASLSMSPAALQAGLKVLGHTATFVDLEADPKIDRDHPPDLAKHVPEAAAASPVVESSAPAQAEPPPTKQAKKPDGKQKPAASSSQAGVTQHVDVAALVEDVMQKVAQALLGCKLEETSTSDPYVLARLRADIQMELNSLKNSAYTAGYVAGKGELVGFAEKRFA